MKILLLSCNTGGGHNSAASAMEEYFSSVGVACETRDALAFKSEIKSKVISRGHVFVYKNTPQLFGAGYRFLENHPPKLGQASIMYDSVKHESGELYDFLEQNDFDAVVCTHLFAAMIVTEMKKKFSVSIKTYLIVTDYTCYPGMCEVDLDRIFIPHPLLAEEYIEKGVPKEKIISAGIPVKQSFYQKTDMREAKRALGLDAEKRMVLMMCGSMGCGPLWDLASCILEKLPCDTLLTVICGSNEKLYDKLQKIASKDRLLAVSFTDQVARYMDACEVVLTKPGGLSATEAATKGIPIVLVDAVPGCETKNKEFFVKHGFAVTSEGVGGLSDAVISLLNDRDRRERMIASQRNSFSVYRARVISERILWEAVSVHG